MHLDKRTITSLEISEITGETHTNVMKNVRAMLDGLRVDESRFESGILTMGKERPIYVLPEREAIILVRGYQAAIRAKIVDYFNTEAPHTTEAPPKHYPIEALVMLNGHTIVVDKILNIYANSYRVVTNFNRVKLVFFHAIAYVENGNHEN